MTRWWRKTCRLECWEEGLYLRPRSKAYLEQAIIIIKLKGTGRNRISVGSKLVAGSDGAQI